MSLKRAALFLSLLLPLAACSGGPAPTTATPLPSPSASSAPVDLATFVRSVNDGRRALTETEGTIDLSPWTADFSNQLNLLTPEEMQLLLTPHEAAGPCTLQQLTEDAETAFTLLKTTYGAYDYFGGDEVFLPLLDQVKAGLAEARYPTASVLSDLLYQALAPVLRDGHFSIDGKRVIADQELTMYYVPGLFFDDPSGLDPDCVKLTVAGDGHIAYGFAALTRDPFSLPDRAVVEGKEVPLSWVAAAPAGRTDPDAYRETQWEGLPVLHSRSMASLTPEQEAQLTCFAASGPEWAEHPAFVFDVRSNSGGNSRWMAEWSAGFLGAPARPKKTFAHKYSSLGVLGLGYPKEQMGTWNVYAEEGTFAENDSLILLLQDTFTASAGEEAVQILRSMDNVLILGSNTSGCSLVPDNHTYYLPHTGLSLFFGTGLSFDERLENRDGTGFLPDLWVDPQYAEEAVLRLCKYYDLMPQE